MKLDIQAASYIPAIGALLQRSGLPITDFEAEVSVSLFVVSSTDDPVGVISLEVYGPNVLLRSLAVSDSERGKGLGTWRAFRRPK